MKNCVYVFGMIIAAWLSVEAQTINPVFTPGHLMSVPRMGHQSILLPNNNVLLIGGHGTNFVSLSTADLYFPASDSFALQTMNYYHDGGAIETLPNGKIIIAGGAADLGVAPGYASTEIFNPADNSFTPTGSTLNGHMLNCAATLRNGNVLAAGGWYNTSSASYAEMYSPGSGLFSSGGSINYPRANCILIPTADTGAILLSGCPVYGGSVYESVEYYSAQSNTFTTERLRLLSDPNDSSWIPLLYINYYRLMSTQKMKDGRYVLLASKAFGDSVVSSLVTVDPVTKEIALFRTKTSLPSSKVYGYFGPIVDTAHSVVYIPACRNTTDSVYVTLIAVNLLDSTVAYPSGEFTMPAGRYISGTNFVLLNNGKILMSGGTTSNDYYTNFNPFQYTYLITPNYHPVVTAVSPQPKNIPSSFALNQNYPNPFNPSTTISYSIGTRSTVQLRIYDLVGRTVATLVNDVKSPGEYHIQWNAAHVASGVYFYRLTAGSYTSVKKLVLLK